LKIIGKEMKMENHRLEALMAEVHEEYGHFCSEEPLDA